MSERLNVMPICPFCGGEVEIGCLMGKDSFFAFQWYDGDPTFWKNLIPHEESVGGDRPTIRDTHDRRAMSEMPENRPRLLISGTEDQGYRHSPPRTSAKRRASKKAPSTAVLQDGYRELEPATIHITRSPAGSTTTHKEFSPLS
jgi:hypothetical protein